MEIRFESPPGKPPEVWIEGERYVAGPAYDKVLADAQDMAERLARKDRSVQTHRHYFARIKDLWETLPESVAAAPYAKSPDHLRKHALIQTGHCETDVVDCESHQVALAAAPIIAKNARRAHGYALIVVRDTMIVCTVPKSQSFKAMDKDEFQASKQAVLDWIEGFLADGT